jgi:3-deoxy-alpha-D-manno-octulosonate 8-oxidase
MAMMKEPVYPKLAAQRSDDNRFVVVCIDGVHQGKPLQARIPAKMPNVVIWMKVGNKKISPKAD